MFYLFIDIDLTFDIGIWHLTLTLTLTHFNSKVKSMYFVSTFMEPLTHWQMPNAKFQMSKLKYDFVCLRGGTRAHVQADTAHCSALSAKFPLLWNW